MLNNSDNPCEWAMLLYELQDARDHLEKLIEQMNVAGSVQEIDYGIQLGHVYSRLNCAWNGRDTTGEFSEEVWKKQCRFPEDLQPV